MQSAYFCLTLHGMLVLGIFARSVTHMADRCMSDRSATIQCTHTSGHKDRYSECDFIRNLSTEYEQLIDRLLSPWLLYVIIEKIVVCSWIFFIFFCINRWEWTYFFGQTSTSALYMFKRTVSNCFASRNCRNRHSCSERPQMVLGPSNFAPVLPLENRNRAHALCGIYILEGSVWITIIHLFVAVVGWIKRRCAIETWNS